MEEGGHGLAKAEGTSWSESMTWKALVGAEHFFSFLKRLNRIHEQTHIKRDPLRSVRLPSFNPTVPPTGCFHSIDLPRARGWKDPVAARWCGLATLAPMLACCQRVRARGGGKRVASPPLEEDARSTSVLATLCVVILAMTCNQVSQLTLPVALPGILQSMDNADVVAILPGVGTAFFALGKLSVVVATHHLGPTLVLTGACFLSGAGLLLFALGSWSLQIIGWSTVSYAVAHMWGSSARVIANWVDDEHRGRAYGFSFGLATDGGSALASFVYGATLSRTGAEGWRFLFLGAGAYTLAVAALVARTVRGSAQEAGHRPPLGAAVRHVGGGWRQEDAHPLAHATLPEALGVFLRSGRVMLACCATSGFACTAGTLQICNCRA